MHVCRSSDKCLWAPARGRHVFQPLCLVPSVLTSLFSVYQCRSVASYTETKGTVIRFRRSTIVLRVCDPSSLADKLSATAIAAVYSVRGLATVVWAVSVFL